jgi:hypothetical protein
MRKTLKEIIRECIKEVGNEDNIIRGVDFRGGRLNRRSEVDWRYEEIYEQGANDAAEGIPRDENPYPVLRYAKAWDDGWTTWTSSHK